MTTIASFINSKNYQTDSSIKSDQITHSSLQLITERIEDINISKNIIKSTNYSSYQEVNKRFWKNLTQLRTNFLSISNTYSQERLYQLNFNQEFKNKALKLVEFFKKNFIERTKKIEKNLENKLHRKLEKDELNAKIYNLALNIQLEVFIHPSSNLEWSEMPDTWQTPKNNKQAPHTKLLKPLKNLFFHIKTDNPRNYLVENQTKEVYLLYNKILGEGTYNKAYLVYDIIKGLSFVSRELKKEQRTQEGLISWDQEAFRHKNLMLLEVPGIVKLDSIYLLNETFFKRALILEKCDGDLPQIPIKLDSRLQYSMLSQIFKCLIALHETGYVHRDIKPANIFYTYKDKVIETKVGDFGFLTKQGTKDNLIGTYFYQPWEAFLINFPVSTNTDSWAAGMIAYHLRYCLGSADFLHRHVPCLDKNYEDFTKQMGELRWAIVNALPELNKLDDIEFKKQWLRKNYPLLLNSKNLKPWLKNEEKLSVSLLNNEIIYNDCYPKIEQTFTTLRSHLTNDPYDQIIAGLLNPIPAKRISLTQALTILQKNY
jgi:serine/threonine protein kinase